MIGTHIHTKSTVTVDVRTEHVHEEPEIKTLNNSNSYFLNYAFLLFEKDGVRLVYYNSCAYLFFNKKYKTERGARIAFSKQCRNRKARIVTKPEWTFKYTPEKKWLEDRYNRNPFYYKGMHS